MGQAPPIPPEGGSSSRDGFGSAVERGATRPTGRVLSRAARDGLPCRRSCFCSRDAGRHATVMPQIQGATTVFPPQLLLPQLPILALALKPG